MRFILPGLALLLVGCAEADTTLVNAQGERVQCSARGYGIEAATTAAAEHDECVNRRVAAGFSVASSNAAPATPERSREDSRAARRNRRMVSSGVQQLGPDTYLIALSGQRGGVVASEGTALAQAAAFCHEHETEILVLAREAGRGRSYTLTFRCLRPGDPELQRPPVAAAPGRESRRR